MYASLHREVNGEEIALRERIKYLEGILDLAPSLRDCLMAVAGMAGTTVNVLTKLMPRRAGFGSRKVLVSIANSMMLYTVMAGTRWVYVQRKMVLRVTGKYRTVPTDSILVVAGLIPIHLLA